MFPLVGVVFEPLNFVCIIVMYFVASIMLSCLGLLFPSLLVLTSNLFLCVIGRWFGGSLGKVGLDWVRFGDDGGIVKWLEVHGR